MLVVGVGVLALALLAWLTVGPSLRGCQVAAVPTAQATWQPEITNQPQWTLAAQLPTLTGNNGANVQDTGIANVVTVNWAKGDGTTVMQSVDLAVSKLLWTATTHTWIQVSSGNAVFISDQDGKRLAVDAITGQPVASAIIPWGDVVFSDGQTVVMSDYFHEEMCVAAPSDLATCLWQATWLYSGPDVFGSEWVNTTSGVIDISTGKPASFGADVVNSGSCEDFECGENPPPPGVFYAGQADAVLRVVASYDDAHPLGKWSAQSWDTSSGTARGGVRALDGIPADGTWDLSALIIAGGYDFSDIMDGSADTGPTRLTAYSWQTGKRIWQTKMPRNFGDFSISPVGSDIYLGSPCGDYAMTNPASVLDAKSGKQVWSGSSYCLLSSGANTAYLISGDALYSFDIADKQFSQSWSVQFPSTDAGVFVLANRIVAISPSTGQLWTLTG